MSSSNAESVSASANSAKLAEKAAGPRRPTSSILAPSKLSFGRSDSNSGSSATSESSTRLTFPGLKASKLSTVTQSVCANLTPTEGPAVATLAVPSPIVTKETRIPQSQKPSFIPLKKEPDGLIMENDSNSHSKVLAAAQAPNSSMKATNGGNPAVNVFGQNLNDRAANFDSVSNGGKTESSENSPNTAAAAAGSTGVTSGEKAKTLSEAAAEYCESHAKKLEYEEVETFTGEENEVNAVQMSAKLYLFEKTTSSWTERGRGQLRLNDIRTSQNDNGPSARLVMRTAGSLRVILNTKIFPEMNVEKPTEKNIRLTGMDDLNEQSVKVFLVGGSPKDIGGMYAALRRRVDKLKAESATTSLGNEGASDVSGSIKRKHDGNGDIPVETTRPEKEAKTT